jgi:hypothetical protein
MTINVPAFCLIMSHVVCLPHIFFFVLVSGYLDYLVHVETITRFSLSRGRVFQYIPSPLSPLFIYLLAHAP